MGGHKLDAQRVDPLALRFPRGPCALGCPRMWHALQEFVVVSCPRSLDSWRDSVAYVHTNGCAACSRGGGVLRTATCANWSRRARRRSKNERRRRSTLQPTAYNLHSRALSRHSCLPFSSVERMQLMYLRVTHYAHCSSARHALQVCPPAPYSRGILGSKGG